MIKLLKSVRFEKYEWDLVEAEAARIGLPATTFVRLFVVAGMAPDGLDGLDDKVEKARRYFGKGKGAADES